MFRCTATSVFRILVAHKLHPFKIEPIHELKRILILEFCEELSEKLTNNPN